MRKIYVLAVEIRQRPAIIQVAEDEVKIIIVGKVSQIVFFLQDDVISYRASGLSINQDAVMTRAAPASSAMAAIAEAAAC